MHRAAWPAAAQGDAGSTDLLLDTASAVLSEIRRTKTEAKVSQRAGVARVVVTCGAEQSAAVRATQSDIVRAGSVAEFAVVAADDAAEDSGIRVAVTLAAT